MPRKVIFSILFEKKRIWAKILHSTFSFKSVLVSTICINKVLFIEILNQKIFWSKRAISSRFVILGGVFNLITCSKETHFVELSSTWLQKWFRIKTTTILSIFGHWESFFTSLFMAELLSLECIQEKLAIRLWEDKSDLSQVFRMSTKI